MREHMMKEDWDFYHRIMANIPSVHQAKAEAKYFRLFEEGMTQEQVLHRKANAGRLKANRWLSTFAETGLNIYDMLPVMINITKADWSAGKSHLEQAHQDKLLKFGNQVLGFAAEKAVSRWLGSQDIPFEHNDDPQYTGPDFKIFDKTVDLKSVDTKGQPRPRYLANLADSQRANPKDWYMFGKLDNTTDGDYYLIGFATEKTIMKGGTYHREGDMTKAGMQAPVDCWCIEYEYLIPPREWIKGMQNEK